eukprot:UN0375
MAKSLMCNPKPGALPTGTTTGTKHFGPAGMPGTETVLPPPRNSYNSGRAVTGKQSSKRHNLARRYNPPGIEDLARAMRVEVRIHVVRLLHHLAQVVKGLRADLMAVLVDVPRDGVRRADSVVVPLAGSGTGIHHRIGVANHGPTVEEVVDRGAAVDDLENLALHDNHWVEHAAAVSCGAKAVVHAVRVGGLHICGREKGCGRVHVVDLVGLPHLHIALAVLEGVRCLLRRGETGGRAHEPWPHRARSQAPAVNRVVV